MDHRGPKRPNHHRQQEIPGITGGALDSHEELPGPIYLQGSEKRACSLSQYRHHNWGEIARISGAVRPMTHFLRDILRQPKELQRTIDFLLGVGRPVLDAATAAIRGARHVYLTGIGSSWHAALCAGTLFNLGANPVYLYDTAELLEFAEFPSTAVVIVISRSGRSVEIVKLLAKVRERGAIVIAITNSAEGPLAQGAQLPIAIPIELDHAISVNTYSSLAATAGILASAAVGNVERQPCCNTISFLREDRRRHFGLAIAACRHDLACTGGTTYFLARGCSTGSCQEARLLWEEGVKSPATAMNTGSFRHGPQEMVTAGARLGIWIDAERMRGQDLPWLAIFGNWVPL